MIVETESRRQRRRSEAKAAEECHYNRKKYAGTSIAVLLGELGVFA